MFSYVTVRCRQLRSTWEKARLNNPLGCASAELACQVYQDSCKLIGSVVLSRKTSSRWSQNALRKERKKILFVFFFFFQASFVHHKQVKMRSILSLLYFVVFCFCSFWYCFCQTPYQSWYQQRFWLIGTLIQPVHLSHAPFYKVTVLGGCMICNLHCSSSLRSSSHSAINMVLASQIESLFLSIF